MDFKLIIDKDKKEEIIVYAKEKTPLIEEIEALVKNSGSGIIGYAENEAVNVAFKDVCCFTIEKNKLYAVMDNRRLLIKERLYQIEERLGFDFVKINQSSIANVKKIDRFKASIGGSLMVLFKNGYKDYVSRRQTKSVKERMGIK